MSGEPVIVMDGVSKWYGPVLGISDISWTVRPGIVGLLGPNGAGKSTLMKLLVGIARPSRGSLRVFGGEPWSSRRVRREIGYCPEHEGMYDDLTALEFVTAMARLAGAPQPAKAARDSLAAFGMSEAQDRLLGGFSKGMRQRTKLAQCLAHQPTLIILDEPLTGVDPVARAEIVQRIRDLGSAGHTVVVSSHVLYEIEALTDEIMVVYRGQVLAEGNIYEIRTLIDKHPHRIRIECAAPRQLARKLASLEHISQITFDKDTVVAETRSPDECYGVINRMAVEDELEIYSLTSPDNNLSAVFDYLTGGGW